MLSHTSKALECYIEPFLMHGFQAWTILKQLQKKLEATEICGSFGECYESHRLIKNQTEQCYKKPTQQDHS